MFSVIYNLYENRIQIGRQHRGILSWDNGMGTIKEQIGSVHQ